MRILILGGTSFIGRAIARALLGRGDVVALYHRGRTEPPELARAIHIHGDRADLPAHRPEIRRFRPDAVVDTYALTREDAAIAASVVPDGIPAIVLSSQDVYAAFDGFVSGEACAAVPLREDAPLRERRHLYRDDPPPGVPARYEKIDVEEGWSIRGATVLRLPMVYGPGDPQCREGFVLRRILAGRRAIPVGAGNLLWSRAHVEDVAAAVVAALGQPAARGTTINLAEPTTVSIRQWMQQIASAAEAQIDLVRVAEDALPPDLMLTKAHPQHVLVDTRLAEARLSWAPEPVEARVADSVRWHLEHRTPAPWTAADAAADDRALRRPHGVT
ncbi:NAD-dependent epimerase/dehydratase family protein [Agromyces silvae]|uniref:NAD-dependent epimerase/dehydratase family protein n=1 Tax=Agromyces silvae TaxID=3388266 RepID=UPI00280AB9C8|nr:NAD-dependent epimerase/dehydratase family protein [Agromyces protaetiae]